MQIKPHDTTARTVTTHKGWAPSAATHAVWTDLGPA